MIDLRMLLQENGAASKEQEGKILTCPKAFFTWAGIDFPLPDDHKVEGEEEEEQKEEEDAEEKEEEEEEEDEKKVQGTHDESKIFHLPEDICTYFCYFVCFLHRLALISFSAITISNSNCSIFSAEIRSTKEKLLLRERGRNKE